MKFSLSKIIVFLLLVSVGIFLSLPSPVSAAGKGFWSTKEGKIVDKDGNIVRIAGVNWGFNPYNSKWYGQLFGSTKANYRDMIKAIKTYGFNTIRLTWIDYQTDPQCKFDNSGKKNDELVGLTCLQVLDKIVEYAGQLNLRIILDHHSPNRRGYMSTSWIPSWQKLATRYKGNETIIGADLDNEPGGCWGCGESNDWRSAAAKAGNAIHTINPDWLLIVEDSPGTNNLVSNVQTAPVKIYASNKIVYSTHVYGWTITTPNEWDLAWGNLVKLKIAPVLVGEFNLHFVNSRQLEWFDNLINYMKNNEIGGTGWAWLYDDPKYSGESWYVQSLINPDYLTLQNDNRQKSFDKWYVRLDPIINKPSPSPSLQPGDANSDGKIDGVDYTIWLLNYGRNKTGAQFGDFNEDNSTDGADYVIWLTHAQ